mmetsp:Transcript_5383/g.12856  ORF Transcript_5383/g.12856 Transcript_5383/m.12856 type:complete len:90 (+) Transcript_5383:145-414(+)
MTLDGVVLRLRLGVPASAPTRLPPKAGEAWAEDVAADTLGVRLCSPIDDFARETACGVGDEAWARVFAEPGAMCLCRASDTARRASAGC